MKQEWIKWVCVSLIIIVVFICMTAVSVSYIGYEIDIRMDGNTLEAFKLALNQTNCEFETTEGQRDSILYPLMKTK